MLTLLFRRLINNKWLFLCLLLGAISTTAIISAIPMYANGILQKVLTKDLENAQLENNVSPGKFSLLYNGNGMFNPEMFEKINMLDQTIQSDFIKAYPLPVLEQVRQLRYDRLLIQRTGDDFYNKQKFMIYPTAIDGYESKVKWLFGQAPSPTMVDGVYEVAIADSAMKTLQLMKDKVYDLSIENRAEETVTPVIQFKIVGVFTVEDSNSLFWTGGRYDSFINNLVFDRQALVQMFDGQKPFKLKDSENVLYYDDHQLYIGDIPAVLKTYATQKNWTKKQGTQVYAQFPVINLLHTYAQRQKQLRITLWILMIPLMIIMAFYAVIVSNLIVQNDKNEIAMLKSRGAKRIQIFLMYLAECIVIALMALLTGPLLSVAICKLLGASNGFLEFVSRKAMMVKLTGEVYQYSLVSIGLYSAFVLLPVVKASRIHIVQYKRSLLKSSSKPLWQRAFLDVIILGLSLYGLQLFKSRQNLLGLTGVSTNDLKIDPILFFISTMFILGMSLVFLRVYPWIVRRIFALGQRRWHPVMYFSLVNVGRADKNLQAIMLFLILSISFGIINANQARTINSNTVDRVAYAHGAEVVITPYNNLLHQGMAPTAMNSTVTLPKVTFSEPPYNKYKKIEGIESITKVYNEKLVKLSSGKTRVSQMTVQGITPNEYGETAWFRNDLLNYHINAYLNLLASAPKAILLSSNMAKDFGFKIGDTVYVDIGNMGALECSVYAFVDYWPGYNPFDEKGKKQYLGVMNATYIHDKLPLHAYEIWAKKMPNTLDHDIQNQLDTLQLKTEKVSYMQQEIIQKKNDPLLLGTNGILTLCFMIEMIIATVGFIIFWALSIRERSLKFGIFRAIGMPMSQVGWIMVCEQLLVSGVAIALGFLLGSYSSKLFIPLLELVYSSAQQVPKFIVVAQVKDYYKVMLITSFMVISGLLVLIRQVKSLKVNQVIKLGEDS